MFFDSKGFSKAAEILLIADGKILLVSNRGYGPHSGTVVGFKVNADGQLAGPGVANAVEGFVTFLA